MSKIKQKYYAILSKKDNFLHGAFPFSKEGYEQAKLFIDKKSEKNKEFYIKKK
jgi:hypothetical protein